MNKARTIDGILFEAIYHAARRATGLSAQEAGMYEQVREDLEKHGGYEAAHERDIERAGARETTATVQEAATERKRAAIVFRIEADELTRRLDEVGPKDEETGEDLPAGDVAKPALVQKARGVLQQLLNGFVPTAVTVKLLDLYLAVRREYDDQVRVLNSKAGISDERRPSMRERFDEDRLQTASETLAEAAPYEWGRTSLVVG